MRPATDAQLAALRQVRDLIERVRVTPIDSADKAGVVFFMFESKGAVRLAGAVADLYRRTLRGLIAQFAPEGEPALMSPRAVEKHLKHAVLDALGLKGQGQRRRTAAFARRMEAALTALEAALLADPLVWCVHVPLQGLHLGRSPRRFGRILFKPGRGKHLRELADVIRDYKPDKRRFTEAEIVQERSVREEEATRLAERFTGPAIATIEVEAVDGDAALALGVDEIARTVDVLSFFAPLVDQMRFDAAVWMPTDAPGEPFPYLVERGEWRQWGGRSFGRVPMEFRGKGKKVGLHRVDGLLVSDPRTNLVKRILTAITWAGRAHRKDRRDESFVMNMVALEAVLSKSNSRTALTERLCLRAAHLIGRTGPSRRRVYELLGQLYDRRSGIVHRGEADRLTEQEAKSLRTLTRLAIVNVLTRSPFKNMTDEQELEKWFGDRVLADGET